MAFIPINHPSLNKKRPPPLSEPKVTLRRNGVVTITKSLGQSNVKNTIDLLIDFKKMTVTIVVGKERVHKLVAPRYQNISTSPSLISRVIPYGQEKTVIYLTRIGPNRWSGSYTL